MNDMRCNNTVVYICRYHVVFCPKYGRKVLTPPIDERLKVILTEQMERWGQELIELEVMPTTFTCSSGVTHNSGFTDW